MTLAKLTVLFGESDRVGGHLVADELMRACEGSRAAVLLRASEGFGIKHQLHTDRLLTLSEDLPLAVVAIDEQDAVQSLADRVAPLVRGGLVTIESATPIDHEHDADTVKLTVLTSRRDPAAAVVDRLQRAGMDAAVVLLGLDGMTGGQRCRARFFSSNGDVPALVVASGPAAAAQTVDYGFAVVERITVCKRDGTRLADPVVDAPDGWWQRISVHASDDLQLITRLRRERAAGATSFHGVWGFSGNTPPHGDRFLSLRRTVPMLTVIVDTPENVARWWPALDALTDHAGLVTSELVPHARPIGTA